MTPHYVAKKSDDRFELVRTEGDEHCADRGWVLAGTLWALGGLGRGGFVGGVVAGIGGSLIYRGLGSTTRAPSSPRPRAIQGEPSFQHDVRPTGQEPIDAVDEASMESFPASDVPASMSGTLPR